MANEYPYWTGAEKAKPGKPKPFTPPGGPAPPPPPPHEAPSKAPAA